MRFKKKPFPVDGEVWDETKEISGIVKQEVYVFKNGKYALQKTKYFMKTAKGEVPLTAGDFIVGSFPSAIVINKETLKKFYEEDEQ